MEGASFECVQDSQVSAAFFLTRFSPFFLFRVSYCGGSRLGVSYINRRYPAPKYNTEVNEHGWDYMFCDGIQLCATSGGLANSRYHTEQSRHRIIKRYR